MTKDRKAFSDSKKALKNTVLFISGILVVFLLSHFVGIEELILSLKRIPLLVLLGLFLMQIITMVLLCFISYKVLKKIIPDLNFQSMWNIHLVGTFVENVTPGTKVGGEFIKICLLKKSFAIEYSKLIIAGVAQKFITMVPFVFLSAICLLYLSKVEDATSFIKIGLFVSGTSIFIIGFVILMMIFLNSIKKNSYFKKIPLNENQRFSGKYNSSSDTLNKNQRFSGKYNSSSDTFLEKKIKSIGEVSSIIRTLGNVNEIAFLLSIAFIVWILYPIKVYIVAYFLEIDIGFIPLTTALFIAFLVGTIPFFPGGLGAFEATMTGILVLFGLPIEDGIILVLISRTVTFWFPIAFTLFPALYTLFNLKNK